MHRNLDRFPHYSSIKSEVYWTFIEIILVAVFLVTLIKLNYNNKIKIMTDNFLIPLQNFYVIPLNNS